MLVPCFMNWNKRSQKCSICIKSLFLSNLVNNCFQIHVSENFSFAKIIHPPDRCGISRSWLNSMTITQVHFVQGTIKHHSKMGSFVTTQCHRVLREHAIGMLIAGMSTRAVARKCNVNYSTVSCLQHHFREFVSTSNQPHNHRPRMAWVMVWAGIS